MRDILLVPIRATERSFAASLFDAANRRDAAAPEAGPVAVKDCSGADAASIATATAVIGTIPVAFRSFAGAARARRRPCPSTACASRSVCARRNLP